MVCKNEYRKRPASIGFRVPKEMSERINLLVVASGTTKQNHIASMLLEEGMDIFPSPIMYKTLKEEMQGVCKQLNRLRKGENPSEHLLETCDFLGEVLAGLRGDTTESEIETEDDLVRARRRAPKAFSCRAPARRRPAPTS